jgi:hypothetical protein
MRASRFLMLLAGCLLLGGAGTLMAEERASDPAAEEAWSRCVNAMRQARSFKAQYRWTFVPEDQPNQQGTIHLERAGRLTWRYTLQRGGAVSRVLMKSDGKQGTVFISSPARTHRQAHADFLQQFIGAMPAGPEFYEADGLQRYRPPAATVRRVGTQRVGSEVCTELEILGDPAYLTQRYLAGPDGRLRAVTRTYPESGGAARVELRFTGVELVR